MNNDQKKRKWYVTLSPLFLLVIVFAIAISCLKNCGILGDTDAILAKYKIGSKLESLAIKEKDIVYN